MRGLLIRAPHIDDILLGRKKWEIRGSRTQIRGQIALIRSGSGKIFGTCCLADVIGPLSLQQLHRNRHLVGKSVLQVPRYEKTYAWVMSNPLSVENPIPYHHPLGAVIWVTLAPSIELLVSNSLSRRQTSLFSQADEIIRRCAP
jgi:hypothetical protein